MMTDSGVTKIRLRGSNPALANMLPGLYSLAGQCSALRHSSTIQKVVGEAAAFPTTR